MSAHTGIEWTDATWNPIRGCSRVSEGCRNCYAERQAIRQSRPGHAYHGLVRSTKSGPRWTGVVRLIEEHLYDPLGWQVPRRVFVNSMSDLFHEKLTEDDIAQVFAVMALAPRHTFQVLTKRAAEMQKLLAGPSFRELLDSWIEITAFQFTDPHDRRTDDLRATAPDVQDDDDWPLPNVWLGVSVEDQQRANERIPLLLQTPAAVRFLSCEPLLGPVDILEAIRVLHRNVGDFHPVFMQPGGIDWVIVGGESGPGARPCDVQWIRAIVEQCQQNDVAVFVKQLGSEPGFKLEDEERRGNTMPSFHHAIGDLFVKKLRDRKGGDPGEWPEDLRVREMPLTVVRI